MSDQIINSRHVTKHSYTAYTGITYEWEEINFIYEGCFVIKPLYKAKGHISLVHPLLLTECKYCGAPYPMYKCGYCGKVQQ